jgi:hypothetical protein
MKVGDSHLLLCVFVPIVLLSTSSGLAARVAPPLPPPSGPVVNVANVGALMSAVSGAAAGTTVMVADGFYDLGAQGHSISITANNVTIRGASGNRNAVVIKGQGMNVSSGSTPTLFHVYSDDVTIADLTLRDSWYHLVQVHGESIADRFRLYNCRMLDSGEQFVKVSVNVNTQPKKCENGIVEYCLFEFATTSRWWYTHGVDILNGKDWLVRDTVFRNIRGPAGVVTGGAILAWQKTEGTIVERCEFYECDFGVNFGNSGGGVGDHVGGVIRNNFFFRKGNFGDVAITCNHAQNFQIHNNTCILNGTFPWVIDYRFSDCTGTISHTITDGNILARDGATATRINNITSVQPAWFVDHANGDLHLRDTAAALIDQAAPVTGVIDDIDADPRPVAGAPDIGADEFRYAGDVDADGLVDVVDLLWLVDAFGSATGDANYSPDCDFNHDGLVDVVDLLMLVENFGK